MEIYDVRINGISDPLGFSLADLTCSWKVRDAATPRQKKARITVSEKPDLSSPVCVIEGDLAGNATQLKMELKPRTRYHLQVEVESETEKAVSRTACFETAKMDEPWTADWIQTAEENDTVHPVFFRNFELREDIRTARLYVSGLGLYEAYVNGQKLSDELFAPGCSDYDRVIQYQTYEVTGLKKDNELAILCGNGWYKGRLGYTGKRSIYGERFSCIAELHVTYGDGSREIITTDENWSYRLSSLRESDLYDGEVIDDTAPRSDAKKVRVADIDKNRLTERYSLPVRIKDRLPVREVIRNDIGEVILDFGQNHTGFVSFRNFLPAGVSINLDYGEILQDGHFYNDNYRSARAAFRYVSDGQTKEVRPHFTYYGYRYVRVSCPLAVDPEAFRGNVIYSDLNEACRFHSSDARLNRLFLNTLWGQRSNFLELPTDCPQRDERLGWTGDANVFTSTACYNMDVRAFYRKYLYDLRLDQIQHQGRIANFIPNIDDAGGSSVWGDVATFMPMNLYAIYGDRKQLEDHYPLMKDWVDYVISLNRANGQPYLWATGFHFGDWLALDGISEQSFKGGTDDYYVASMYYYASVLKLAQAAEILGKTADSEHYAALAGKIREAILAEHFTETGRLSEDTQTGYVLALKFGIYRDKEVLIRGLMRRLIRDQFRIRCGFVGATSLLPTLAENGLGQLAYYFLFNEDYPGWFHCLNLGATTIWERWNSVLDDGHVSGTGMNSLNHYAYGSVMEFVYKYMAGLKPLTPGFRQAEIRPQLNWRLGELCLTYESASGKYVSHWRINNNGTVYMHVEIPFDCQAKVWLPGTAEVREVNAGIHEWTYQPDSDFRRKYDENSFLFEMKDDAEALAILRNRIPQADPADSEMAVTSLAQLRGMFYLGIDPQQADACIKELGELRKKMIKGVIFDLDGVICFTDKYHYQAWKQLADQQGIYFDEIINNRLRGVSRMASLEIILERSDRAYTQKEKEEFCAYKNDIYRELLNNMSPADLSDEVRKTLDEIRRRGYRMAIGSSSRNTRFILEKIGLDGYFDAISDGTVITRSKPDPEVFLKAAEFISLRPQDCLVVEDALAGIDAAKAGGMLAAGIGDAEHYEKTDYPLKTFSDLLKIL